MKLVDRILTIVITATLTSAVWIVLGGSLIENATSVSQRGVTRLEVLDGDEVGIVVGDVDGNCAGSGLRSFAQRTFRRGPAH